MKTKTWIFMLMMFFLLGLPIPFLSAQDLNEAIRFSVDHQFTKAETEFNRFIQTTPSDGNIYYYAGDNLLRKYFSDTVSFSKKDLIEAADAYFQKGLKMDSTNPLNLVGLGESSLINKNIPQAVSYFGRANDLILSRINKKTSLTKLIESEVYLRTAEAYIRTGSSDTAQILSLLKKAQEVDRKNPEVYILTGDAYIQLLNNGSVAIKNYNKALDMDPSSAVALVRIGKLWERTDNMADAMKSFTGAVKADTGYALAYRELGLISMRDHHPEEALQNLRTYFRLSPGDHSARIDYINLLIEHKNYDEAIQNVTIARSHDSTDNDFNRALGYAYYETGEYPKSLFYLEKFFANAQPDKLRFPDYYYYGKLLAKEHRDSLAGDNIMKAYRLDTTQGDLLTEALADFVKVRDYDRAVEVVLQKIRLKRDVANDYFILGEIFYNEHQYQKADSVFAIDTRLEPGNIKAYLWRGYSLVNEDPDSKEGLAKPVFDSLIGKAQTDPSRYAKELKEAYGYMAYYYFQQYSLTRNLNEGAISRDYCKKVLDIDPSNGKAKTIERELNERIKP